MITDSSSPASSARRSATRLAASVALRRDTTRLDPAALLFLLLSVAMTWPLPLGLARDVPGDLGDSLLNLWILGWGAEHIPLVLSGRMALSDFWNANIFHPEPLGLGFSEHLFGQVLQILPVYWLSGNLILAYNLLFLTSFLISGWGMYLLARDLLNEGPGFSPAAFVAGVIYAFIPLRIAQVAHIQSLSSQWMPLALLGFRRFIRGWPIDGSAPTVRSWVPLALGSAALLLQNWSSGYYLLFFAPFVVLFVLHQIVAARRGRDGRVWLAFVIAALFVGAGTLPFLSLYLQTRTVHGFERPLAEVIRYSADVYSYFTAPAALRLWGKVLQGYPKPEGELFFGFVPWILIIIAIVWALKPAIPQLKVPGPSLEGRKRIRQVLAWLAVALLIVQLVGLTALVFTGGFVLSAGGLTIRANNATRIVLGIMVALIVIVVVSSRTRNHFRRLWRAPLTVSVALLILAVLLSLGPVPHSGGRAIPDLGVYGVLFDNVPGFDGLRVPARYAMVAALFAAAAATFGARVLLGLSSRPVIVGFIIAAVFLLEAAFVPLAVNQTWGDSGVIPPPRVATGDGVPAVYKHLATLADARIVTELPFGDPAWELRYVYYSTVHWKRLVNGYSGGFPQSYKARVARLGRIQEAPEEAWRTLIEAGTTHVIVHEAAFPPGGYTTITSWLRARGATEIGQFGGDWLYAIGSRSQP